MTNLPFILLASRKNNGVVLMKAHFTLLECFLYLSLGGCRLQDAMRSIPLVLEIVGGVVYGILPAVSPLI